MNIILSALILGSEPIVEEQNRPAIEIRAKARAKTELGRDAISQIRSDYNSGKYTNTLKELDDSYAEVSQDNGLQNLAEMRIGPIAGQAVWEEMMTQTLNERNQELQRTLGEETGDFVTQVLSATAVHDTEVDQALSVLARLHSLAPGQGNNPDENKIIDIDFEYEYKELYLDMPVMTGQKEEDLKKKQAAVKMEKLDRMLEASRNFQDTSLKSAIETVHAHLDLLLIQSWDMASLHTLTPESPQERSVAKILAEYRDHFAHLSQDFLEKQMAETNAQDR